MSLEDTLKAFMPGVSPSDSFEAAFYNESAQGQGVLLFRGGKAVALFERSLLPDMQGVDIRRLVIHISSCPGVDFGLNDAG